MGEKWKYSLLISLLLISVAINIANYIKEDRLTNYILTKYVSEIHRAERAFEESLTKDKEASKEDEYYFAYEATRVAVRTAETLGMHDKNYSLKSDVEIYLDVPSDLSTLVGQAWDEDLNEKELEAIHRILEIHSENITINAIKDPEKFKDTYRNIRNQINKEQIINDLKEGYFKSRW